jgi:hypothetical protein
MGRKKIEKKLKKQKTSINIAEETNRDFWELKIKNKSKLVNELLREFFEVGESAENSKEANNE